MRLLTLAIAGLISNEIANHEQFQLSQVPLSQANDIYRYLKTKECNLCELEGSDLVNLDLKNSQLRSANLQNSNISGSILDGSNLRDSNLSHTSLQGASLRGVNLINTTLKGTDLRNSDLTGARILDGGLSQSYWEFALGLDLKWVNYSDIYNSAVRAYLSNRYKDSEYLFGLAILKIPDKSNPWLARAASRFKLGMLEESINDLTKASNILLVAGQIEHHKQVLNLRNQLKNDLKKKSKNKSNGAGIDLLGSTLSVFKLMSPF